MEGWWARDDYISNQSVDKESGTGTRVLSMTIKIMEKNLLDFLSTDRPCGESRIPIFATEISERKTSSRLLKP